MDNKRFTEPGSLAYRQTAALQRLLPPGAPIHHLSWRAAASLIRLHSPHAWWRREPASDRQRAFLEKHRLWTPGLTKGEASEIIGDVLARESASEGS
jgi:hypothetical protein